MPHPDAGARGAAALAAGLLGLLLADVAGEGLARVTGARVPGPVIGMLLMLALLFALRRAPGAITRASDLLTRHLSLFFVPAAVAVVEDLGVLRSDAAPIALALVVSTVVGLATAAIVFAVITRRGPSS